MFHRSAGMKSQQDTELEALSNSVRLRGPAYRLVGDNRCALCQVSSFRAGAGLCRQNRHLGRFFYMWGGLQATVYLDWIPGNLNPADCFSTKVLDWKGDFLCVSKSALDRMTTLDSYGGLPAHVWILGVPKDQRVPPRNRNDAPLGVLLVHLYSNYWMA